MRWIRGLFWSLGAAAGFAAGVQSAAAEAPIRLHTNEAYVEEVRSAAALDMSDAMAVLAHVLRSLPDEVTVYPTENYYYFRFVHNGTPYAGSIRLPAEARDRGTIVFGYYKEAAEWMDGAEDAAPLTLDAAKGVVVQRVSPLAYRVTYADRSVTFRLNDLGSVRPPASAIIDDETYLGPIFDESGVRFFLVFNERLKVFHYVLDETVPATDELQGMAKAPRVLIGRRTGFAYYRDHRAERKILIGVFEPNSRLNTYFDGPFDQLPENFIEGEALRAAIVAAEPEVKGQIDRLGNYVAEEGRYLIHPYMLYRHAGDLLRMETCASSRVKRPKTYARCFVVAPEVTEVRRVTPRHKRR